MLTTQQATVYHSSEAGRRFFTLKSACLNEAKYKMRAKYGYEPYEPDTGGFFDPFVDEEYKPILDRYVRMLIQSVEGK
jgi:hypothetical protein